MTAFGRAWKSFASHRRTLDSKLEGLAETCESYWELVSSRCDGEMVSECAKDRDELARGD